MSYQSKRLSAPGLFFIVSLLLLGMIRLSQSKREQELLAQISPDESYSTAPSCGDFYVEASLGDASYLNPLLATDSASGQINSLVYNGLVRYNRDLKLEGELAESWDISADGKSLTFHLRRGVYWHDGEPFTATDVEFTYRKLIDPSVRTPFSSDYQLIEDCAIVDPYTIRFTYGEPFAPALESWGIGIIPAHIFAQNDFQQNPANRRPVGTGPFRFREWQTDERIILESNSAYFEGRPHIDRYVFRIIPDQAVQFLELRKENLDSMVLTPDQYNAYPEFFIRYQKFRYPSFGYTYLGFNLHSPFFRERRLREAIARSINKEELVRGVLLGYARPASGPFPPASWAYDPTVEDYPYSPAVARQILAQAGWKDSDGDGWLDKDGQRFEFTLISNQGNKNRILTATIIQNQLRHLEIKVNIRILEWSVFIQNYINKRNFEAVILAWSLSRDPDQYAIWHSSQQGETQYNFVGYQNPEVDRLLEEGRRIFDQNRRQPIYQKIHRILAIDLPYVFLYYPDTLLVVHRRFRGPELSPAGVGWNFIHWYVPQNEQRY